MARIWPTPGERASGFQWHPHRSETLIHMEQEFKK